MNNSVNCRIPQFSIIVPAYGVDQYIGQCIDSVLAQTFSGFELILVDDGSADKCGEICDNYKAIDDRIIVVHKPNSGVSDARNVGLALARAEYIMFLDSDDWIDNKLLDSALEYMKSGYDILVFNFFTAYPDKIISEFTYACGEFIINNDKERIDFFFSVILRALFGGSVSDRVFKRSIIENFKIEFIDNKKIFMEDFYFSFCYCVFAKKILSIEDRFLFYRQREDSCMHTDGRGLNFNRINEFGKAIYHFFLKNNCQSFIDVFPQMYYFLIRNNIWKLLKQENMSLSQIRRLMIDDIEDISFFKRQMKGITKQKYISAKAYSKREFMDMKSTAKYFLNGREGLFKTRNRLINFLFFICKINTSKRGDWSFDCVKEGE